MVLQRLARGPRRLGPLASDASAALGRDIPLRRVAVVVHRLVTDQLAELNAGTATLTERGLQQAARAHREVPEEWQQAAEQLLLALLAEGPATSRQLIVRLSDPMSRRDCEATLRRLYRRGHARSAPDTTPREHHLTIAGARVAERLAADGGSY